MLNKKTLAKIKAYFSKQPDVIAVYLYGSQARGNAGKKSDIDLAVLLDEKKGKGLPSSWGGRHVNMMTELGLILKKELEIQDLYLADVSFIHRVLTEGKLLYSSNESERVEFETNSLNQYFDLGPLYREYDQILEERAREGFIGKPTLSF